MSAATATIDLYDHEIIACEQVLEELNKKQGRNVPLERFRIEAIERFEDIGLVVQVKVYETDQEDCYYFEINIHDRCEPKPFDYARQSWEVVNDIAGIEPEKKGVTFDLPSKDPADIHLDPHKLHTHADGTTHKH